MSGPGVKLAYRLMAARGTVVVIITVSRADVLQGREAQVASETIDQRYPDAKAIEFVGRIDAIEGETMGTELLNERRDDDRYLLGIMAAIIYRRHNGEDYGFAEAVSTARLMLAEIDRLMEGES